MREQLRLDLVFAAALALCLAIAGRDVLALPIADRNAHAASQILLRVMLFGYCGMGGLGVGLVHLVREADVASAIGWPAGNPFHQEVAVANISLGVLGILTRWTGPEFWTATAIGTSLFLLGAGVVHAVDVRRGGGRPRPNASAIISIDLLAPVVILGALVVFRST